MKAEQARKLLDEALDRLASDLERGGSESLKRFLAAAARFHRYSFGNVMLIMAQRPGATRVAGFQTWKSLGRYVRAGEKGIVILAPMMVRSREEIRDTASTEPQSRPPVLRFRAVHVFDLSQTEGQPLPEFARVSGDPGVAVARLRALIASKGIELVTEVLPANTRGYSLGGKIGIAAGLSAAEEFSTLVHELAHELLHRGERRPPGLLVRETEAEAVAFVVSTGVGLDAGTASSDYIRLYRGKKEDLLASLEFIRQTASEILSAVQSGISPSTVPTV